ncbi:FAD dependent oxidoreductase, putative [Synechococcus sp. PCC 7335]|uniref:glutathione-disulfide reductase n=1 Tax=Synechococcus sp. (strain ATCC 29403 / PCC 7335) TaxID=91464 RepID=UPI00017EB499|nr:glutathione-disulfide reductase [Synechococcus sp. PCC 7335]EDX86004.1 FAD dependent oxidoreductase, putative [Synechococcus sp. PCC 7335]
MTYDFDLFVIGGGSGGIAASRRAASYGAKVAVAEAHQLGGTCVNRGCVPKKLMVYASRFPKAIEESAGYGWKNELGEFNWKTMITAVQNEVDRLNAIYQRMIDSAEVKLYRQYAKLLDAHTVEVGDEKVTAERILIAVGGHPVKPKIPGIEHTMSSDGMFELAKQPKRIVILGGGYIGCEFAGIMNGLGTEVTMVIRKDQILHGFDEDLRDELHEALQKAGIKIFNSSEIVGIEEDESGVLVKIADKDSEEDKDKMHTIVADAVCLSATGREPSLDGLGLENTAVEINQGAIAIDKHCQTADPSIYAIGDCTDRINLTPVAINEGRVFADTLYGGKDRLMSYDYVPSAVFTTPEAASVGITEKDAIEEYGEENIHVFRSRFRSMYYTLPNKDQKTLMKLVVHTESDKVLGAHMVGDHAAEIIQGIAIALKMGATKADFDATVGIHPSSAEEFVTMR